MRWLEIQAGWHGLAVCVFRAASVSAVKPVGTVPVSPRFVSGLKSEAWATAEEIDGEFTVLSGSTAKPWKGVETASKSLQDKLAATEKFSVVNQGSDLHSRPRSSAAPVPHPRLCWDVTPTDGWNGVSRDRKQPTYSGSTNWAAHQARRVLEDRPL